MREVYLFLKAVLAVLANAALNNLREGDSIKESVLFLRLRISVWGQLPLQLKHK
ncbi:MAG: hypothetical protein QXV34_02915 [Sulfolobales archaeon]